MFVARDAGSARRAAPHSAASGGAPVNKNDKRAATSKAVKDVELPFDFRDDAPGNEDP